MKKFYLFKLFVLFLLTSFNLKADPVKITISKAGDGESLFTQNKEASELIIEGSMNQIDFMTLHSTCRKVVSLDLSAVTIEAYSDEINYIDYEANELTNALSNSPTLVHLILPKTLKKIGSRALYKCPKLESLTLPGSSVPRTARGGIIESTHKQAVTLFVPEEMLATYKTKMKKAPWSYFKGGVQSIPSPSPWDELIWENVYGANYFPIEDTSKDKVFFAAYFSNKTNKTIDKIEFSYWYDNDAPKTVELKNVQLLPGASTVDGTGFITFDLPKDTSPHLFSIKPIRVNGEDVEKEVRTRPIRCYHLDKTFRSPQHLMEIFVNTQSKDDMEKYANVIQCITRIEGKTRQKGRYNIISFDGAYDLKDYVSESEEAADLVKEYHISSVPRLMLNRDLMTPYGTLQNDKEILNPLLYSPAVKIGDLVTLYDYLISKSFHKPGFATLSLYLTQEKEEAPVVLHCKGEISKDERMDANLRLSLYLVENKELPEYNKDEDTTEVPENTLYGKCLKRLSPKEGIALEFKGENRNFDYSLDLEQIGKYEDGTTKIIALIHRDGEALKVNNGVLQSSSIIIKKESINATKEIAEARENLVIVANAQNQLSCKGEEWKISHIYSLDGRAYAPTTALQKGIYIIQVEARSGAFKNIKYIIQ